MHIFDSETLAHLQRLAVAGVVEAAKDYPKNHGALIVACRAVHILHGPQEDEMPLLALSGEVARPATQAPQCAHGVLFSEACEHCDATTAALAAGINPLTGEKAG